MRSKDGFVTHIRISVKWSSWVFCGVNRLQLCGYLWIFQASNSTAAIGRCALEIYCNPRPVVACPQQLITVLTFKETLSFCIF